MSALRSAADTTHPHPAQTFRLVPLDGDRDLGLGFVPGAPAAL
jgi:hypothetical protein